MNKSLLHGYPSWALAAAVVVTAASWTGSLLAAPADEGAPPPPAAAVAPAKLSAGQLDDLVAPVALYPDALLSQALVACTNPLQIVEADQWVRHHPELKGDALIAAAKQQNWDPSVQALVAFPDALKRLSEDVAWTSRLGEAFLANQGDVMDAVQRMRFKAQENGKLTSTPEDNVRTVTESGKTVVVIEPTNPDVVYVPAYDPAWIWGPAAYYPYPLWYYPPYPSYGYCAFGPPCNIGFSFGFGFRSWCWTFGWFDRCVFIHHDLIHRGHFGGAHFFPEHGFARFDRDAIRRFDRDDFHRFGHLPTGRSAVSPSQVRRQLSSSANRFQASRMPGTEFRGRASTGTWSRSAAPRTSSGSTAPRTFSRSMTPRSYSSSVAPRTWSRSFAPSTRSAPSFSSPGMSRSWGSRSWSAPAPRSSFGGLRSPGLASHYSGGRSFGHMGGGFGGGHGGGFGRR